MKEKLPYFYLDDKPVEIESVLAVTNQFPLFDSDRVYAPEVPLVLIGKGESTYYLSILSELNFLGLYLVYATIEISSDDLKDMISGDLTLPQVINKQDTYLKTPCMGALSSDTLERLPLKEDTLLVKFSEERVLEDLLSDYELEELKTSLN